MNNLKLSVMHNIFEIKWRWINHNKNSRINKYSYYRVIKL